MDSLDAPIKAHIIEYCLDKRLQEVSHSWRDMVANIVPERINIGNIANLPVSAFRNCISVPWKLMVNFILRPPFLVEFAPQLKWANISRYARLGPRFIRQFADQLDWDHLSRNTKISIATKIKFRDRIYWELVPSSLNLTDRQIFQIGDNNDIRQISSYYNLSVRIIQAYRDRLDWTAISRHHRLTLEFCTLFKDDLIWGEIPSCRFTGDIVLQFREKLNPHQLTLGSPESVFQLLADNYPDYLDWGIISSEFTLEEAFIEKFANRVDWRDISKFQTLSPEFISKHINRVNWREISSRDWSDEFLFKYRDYIDWNVKSRTTLSDTTIMRFANRWNWELLSSRNSLSKNIIQTFADQLDWEFVSRYQKLDSEMIRVYCERINWGAFSQRSCLDREILIEFGDRVNWNQMDFCPFYLHEDIVEKYIDRFPNPPYRSYFSNEYVMRHRDELFWGDVTVRMTWNDASVELFADYLRWDCILHYYWPSDEIIIKYIDRIPIDQINWDFNENILRHCYRRIHDWSEYCGKLSEKFCREFNISFPVRSDL